MRVSLDKQCVEHGLFVFTVGFFSINRQKCILGIGRTDQTQIVDGRPANFRVLLSLRGFRQKFRIAGKEERLQDGLVNFRRGLRLKKLPQLVRRVNQPKLPDRISP